jgi:hypothetical protein
LDKNKTLATFLAEELGFLGDVIKIFMQVPFFCGQQSKIKFLFLVFFWCRFLQSISWLFVVIAKKLSA